MTSTPLFVKPTLTYRRHAKLDGIVAAKPTRAEAEMLAVVEEMMRRRRASIIDISARELADAYGCGCSRHAARLVRVLARKGQIIKHPVRGNFLRLEIAFNLAGPAGSGLHAGAIRDAEGPGPDHRYATREARAIAPPPTSPRRAQLAPLRTERRAQSPPLRHTDCARLPAPPIEERAGNSDSGERENVTFNVVGSLLSGGDREPVPPEGPPPPVGDPDEGDRIILEFRERVGGPYVFALEGDLVKPESVKGVTTKGLSDAELAWARANKHHIAAAIVRRRPAARVDAAPYSAGLPKARRVDPSDCKKAVEAASLLPDHPDPEEPERLGELLATVFRDSDRAKSVETYAGIARDVQAGRKPVSVLIDAILDACKPGVVVPGRAFITSFRRHLAAYYRRKAAEQVPLGLRGRDHPLASATAPARHPPT